MNQALLVIDVQNEYFTGKLPVTYPKGSLENILKVMDEASAKGIPVAVIQHTALKADALTFRKASAGWRLHPEILRRPYDVLIEKNYPGSFTGTDLEKWLKGRGIANLIICGYMTQMCCDTTARQAFHRDYSVLFLSDACGTLDQKNNAGSVSAEALHKAVLVVQESRFSKVISTDDWLKSINAK